MQKTPLVADEDIRLRYPVTRAAISDGQGKLMGLVDEYLLLACSPV